MFTPTCPLSGVLPTHHPPVLLVHGDLDANVRVEHSLKMADALKKNGKTVDLLRLPKLEHQLDDSDARVQMLTRIGELLERTIGH